MKHAGHYHFNKLQDVPVIVPAGFSIDNEDPCVVCGGQLDTGLACNDCGADHWASAIAREKA